MTTSMGLDTIYRVTFHCGCEAGADEIAFTDAEGVRKIREEQLICTGCYEYLICASAELATEAERVRAFLDPTWVHAYER